MKTWNYVVMSIVLAMILNFSGINTTSSLLNIFGITREGISATGSLVYLALFGSAGALVGLGTALVIGFFTKSPTENFIILGFFGSYVGIFTIALTSIVITAYNYETWIGHITSLLLSPLIAGFIMTFPEYFRGTD
jgi:hypothetical protein